MQQKKKNNNNHKARGWQGVGFANATGNKGRALATGPASRIRSTAARSTLLPSYMVEYGSFGHLVHEATQRSPFGISAKGYGNPGIKEAASVRSQRDAKVQSINGCE